MVVELSKDFQARYNQLIFSKLQYRNSRTGARSTRTQIDHDVFEGLPVRHWRKKSFNVNAAPEKDSLNPLGTGDTGWPELPMPRDAHMYSPMSEALLRAARMGQVKKPATPLVDDDKEPGEDDDADGDLDRGFVAKRWTVLPKDMEGPEPEFLAKRRKGLPSVYTGATGPLASTAQMIKTKIRKVDTEGNSYIWEVLVPEGQAVDGEIVEEEISPTQAPAPGTVVEGLGIVNAEGVVIAGDQAMPAANRRRPPPPKRKAKGPGRGRKKKVAFTTGTEGAATANGVSAVLNGSTAGADDSKSTKREHEVPDGDTEMGDENVLQEGEEGSEEGSEGEEGEDGDREEGELSPSPTPAKSPAEPPTIVVNDIKAETAHFVRDANPPPSKVPLSSPAEPTREESLDPMLLDDDDDEPTSHSFSENTMTSIPQSIVTMADVAAPVAAEVSEETMPTPESIPRPSEAVVEEPIAAPIAEPQVEVQMKSITTPPPDTTLQPPPEPVEQSVKDNISEDLAAQSTESLAESLTRSATEPTPDVPTKHVTEDTAVSAVEAVAEQAAGPPADLTEEAMPEYRTDNLEAVTTDSVLVSSEGAESEPITNTMSTQTTEVITALKGEPEMELPFEPPAEPVTKPVEEPKVLAVQHFAEQPSAEQSVAEQPMTEQHITEQPTTGQPTAGQSMTEQPTPEQQPMTEQPMIEQPMTEQPPPEQPTPEQPPPEQPPPEQPPPEQPPPEQPPPEQPPTEQPTPEQPPPEQPPPEQPPPEQPPPEQPPPEQPPPEQPTPEQLMTERSATEQLATDQLTTEQLMTQQLTTEQPTIEQPTTEQPTTEQPTTEQPVTEPRARPATEPFPEAISPERRFSYTRVTTSPQAPTPSPPTPIENTFGLKAPYLSPKAPTMSPPTPIQRSMSSSPDIPLADQHFRLPPQIDAVQEADHASAPDMSHIPGADGLSVEAAPNVGSRVNAQLPVEHDPLNGMAEPRIEEESEGSTQHFTDGEEDLLGSLERSLGKHSGRL